MASSGLSIELSRETAEIVDARVTSGRYASTNEGAKRPWELMAEQDAPLRIGWLWSWPRLTMSEGRAERPTDDR